MSERLFVLIERLGSLLRAEQRRAGADHGLQPVHVQVLDYLARCNRYSDTPAALTAYLGTTKGTVSQSLLVLENRGLIKKVGDANDGRVIHLRLSAKGRRLLEALLPPAHWRDALNDIPQTERDGAGTVLEALLRALQRRNDGRTFGQCHTCAHLLHESAERFRCGLTQEPLSLDDTHQLCHEHLPHVSNE